MIAIEPTHLIAVFLALSAAMTNAVSQLCLRIGTNKGKTVNAILIVMIINVVILFPIILFVHYPDYQLTGVSLVSFIAAGIFGTLMGRTLMYTSISKIGASRTAPIVATQAIVATALGIILLDESLTYLHLVGILLTVVGVSVIAWSTSQDSRRITQHELLIGLLIPFGAATAYGTEPIYASFGLEANTPATVGLIIKTIAALFGFVFYLRLRDALPSRNIFSTDTTKWFIFAGFFNTFFLLCYYIALDIAPVSVVVPLHITSTLFVIILSFLFMPKHLEKIDWKLTVSSIVIVTGVALIVLSG